VLAALACSGLLLYLLDRLRLGSVTGVRPEDESDHVAPDAPSVKTKEWNPVSWLDGTGKLAASVLAALACSALLLYFLVGTACRYYFAEFGVSSEDAGITRSILIERMAPGAIFFAAACALIAVLVATSSWVAKHKWWALPLFGVLGPALVVLVVLGWHYTPGVIALFMLLGLIGLKIEVEKSAKAVFALVLIGLGLLTVSFYGFAGIYGWAHARGALDHDEWSTGVLPISTDRVRLEWISSGPNTRKAFPRMLRLLGQGSTQVIVYDTVGHRVLSVPAASVEVIRQPDPRRTLPGRQGADRAPPG
jgi:hypothetical protein